MFEMAAVIYLAIQEENKKAQKNINPYEMRNALSPPSRDYVNPLDHYNITCPHCGKYPSQPREDKQ